MVLNCHNLSDQVRFVKKTKQDNDMINRISAVYVKNETKLSWLIESCLFCDENQIG